MSKAKLLVQWWVPYAIIFSCKLQVSYNIYIIILLAVTMQELNPGLLSYSLSCQCFTIELQPMDSPNRNPAPAAPGAPGPTPGSSTLNNYFTSNNYCQVTQWSQLDHSKLKTSTNWSSNISVSVYGGGTSEYEDWNNTSSCLYLCWTCIWYSNRNTTFNTASDTL